jgi:hypothetical protein
LLQPVVEGSLHHGTYASAQLKIDLADRLGELSPNGKMLRDPATSAVLKRIYDDQLRSDLSAIVGAVGEDFVSDATLQRMEIFSGRETQLQTILRDESLTNKRFLIFCQNCDSPHLAFPTGEQAKEVIEAADRRCAICGERSLQIAEAFSVTPEVLAGVRQGLWLESLACDALSSRTDTVWAGQMVGSNEIDVLAVFADKVVLVECKDTSFGQNDLYVTAMKAEDLKANTVVVISTRDFHENVTEVASRLGQDRRSERAFTLISATTESDIRARLNSLLDDLQAELTAERQSPDRMLDLERYQVTFDQLFGR